MFCTKSQEQTTDQTAVLRQTCRVNVYVAAVCFEGRFDTWTKTLKHKWAIFGYRALFPLVIFFFYDASNTCCGGSAVPHRLVGFFDFAYCWRSGLKLSKCLCKIMWNGIVCILKLPLYFYPYCMWDYVYVDQHKSFGWLESMLILLSSFSLSVFISCLCVCPLAGHCLMTVAVHLLGSTSWLSLTNTRIWPTTAVCCKSITTRATSKVTPPTTTYAQMNVMFA